MTQAMEIARPHESLDSDDDMSWELEAEVTPSGSARTLRSQARLSHHVEILLSSTYVATLKNAMSLLEQISVRAPTRKSYQAIMTEFLICCDNQIPPANVDDPATADVAPVALEIICMPAGTTSHCSTRRSQVSPFASRSLERPAATGYPAASGRSRALA